MQAEGIRDVSQLVVPSVGRVVPHAGEVPSWELQDAAGEPVVPVAQYLTDFAARDMSPVSVRSYALALLRWHRMLWALEVGWDKATTAETRDFVLWLRQARKHRPTEPSMHVPGSVNAKTGKRYPGDGYAPRTINHNLTVVREFYAFHQDAGRGPVRNPVPERRDPQTGLRFATHHNPLQPFRQSKRGTYRQREPRRVPRSMPDLAVDELFAALRCHRDRALIAFYLSSGARPGELLTMTNEMVDPGDQAIGVVRKGSRDLRWLPASPDAFVWLALYQARLPEQGTAPRSPVWWTRREPLRPLNYFAARAVFRRANQVGGTNWTLHDLRHTAAIRMANDPGMSLSDVQAILGHAQITSAQVYLSPQAEDVFMHAQAHFQRLRDRAADPPHRSPGTRMARRGRRHRGQHRRRPRQARQDEPPGQPGHPCHPHQRSHRMSTATAIEWTEVTWNPVTGCDRISPGCDNCYALRLAARLKAMGQAKYQNDGDPRTSGPGFGVTCHEDVLSEPLQWRTPRTVFVNSMSDIAHARVPPSFVARTWAVMALTQRHTFQVLTKRPKRLATIMTAPGFVREVGQHATDLIASRPWQCWQLDLGGQRLAGDSGRGGGWTTTQAERGTLWSPPWPLPNVWVGTSIESDGYTWRTDFLCRVPATTRFLSLEPLLGPLPSLDLAGIDWVIAGGESGPGHRPVNMAWIRDIRDRCLAIDVAFFFKSAAQPPKAGGRELDGRTWDQYPTTMTAG